MKRIVNDPHYSGYIVEQLLRYKAISKSKHLLIYIAFLSAVLSDSNYIHSLEFDVDDQEESENFLSFLLDEYDESMKVLVETVGFLM